MSRGCPAAAMTRQSGSDFAEQQRIALLPHCPVHGIDPARRLVLTERGEFPYGKLVLATGASAARPDLPGSEHLVTLNSQQEFAAIEAQLRQARRILVLGAGLIGCELAMDMASAGKEVTLVDLADSPLSALLPAAPDRAAATGLRSQGSACSSGRVSPGWMPSRGWLARHPDRRARQRAGSGDRRDRPAAESGPGPRGRAGSGARHPGRRSAADQRSPYLRAGDCVQWQGQLLPFLQPIVLGANALARTLLGTPTPLTLPPMLVKVKTPRYPLQLAGRTRGEDLAWQCRWNSHGMVAEARDQAGELCGFVVGGTR